MNNDTTQFNQAFDKGLDNGLDALFSQARAEQPELVDDNFTKIVVNRLPSKVSRAKRHSLSFDAVGLLLGLVAVFMLTDPTQLIGMVLNAVPESLVVTPVVMAAGAFGVFALSLGAWWAVEKKA